MRAYILGIGKTDGSANNGINLWSAQLTRDPGELKLGNTNLTAPISAKVVLVPADGAAKNDAVYHYELPRTNLLDAQLGDAAGFGAKTGALFGRTPPAVTVVLVGSAAAALTGFAGPAVADTNAAVPGALPEGVAIPNAGAPAADLSGVGRDAAAPVAIAHEVLFGDQPAPAAASRLEATIEAGGVLRPGAEGVAVQELQRRLSEIGFSVRATGTYDADTVQAVRDFQRAYRTGADGNFGANSLSLLKAGERVTEPGRTGVGKVWVDGRITGEIELRYINGKPVSLETANALRPMFVAAARAAHPIDLNVVSGYRTYDEQQALYNAYLHHRGNLAAPPGYSNHHSGIALDLNASAPGAYRWLRDNARSFGFMRTVPSERWHWEYRPDLAR